MTTTISLTLFDKALKRLQAKFEGLGKQAPDICIMTGTAGPYFPETEGLPYVTFNELGFGFHGKTEGHAGKIYLFELFGKRICLVAGRVHYNEGNSAEQVAAIPRLIASWGCRNFIITNASGSLNEKYLPGQNIVLTDYHSELPDPMRGAIENELYGKRFYLKHNPFTLQEVLRTALRKYRDNTQRTDIGTYVAVSGPGFESEITAKMYAKFFDLVGMSTAIEVNALLAIDAYLMEKENSEKRLINIGVISYITNLTLAVDGSASISHKENLVMMKKNEEVLRNIIFRAVEAIEIKKKVK